MILQNVMLTQEIRFPVYKLVGETEEAEQWGTGEAFEESDIATKLHVPGVDRLLHGKDDVNADEIARHMRMGARGFEGEGLKEEEDWILDRTSTERAERK